MKRRIPRTMALALAAAMLGAGLSGCMEPHKPFTDADVEALLAERFPDGDVTFRRSLGVGKTWTCTFADCPDTPFSVYVATGGGDPVPAYYRYLACDAPEVFWTRAWDAYEGELDAWSLFESDGPADLYFSTHYQNVEQLRRAADQLAQFYDWCQTQPHADLFADRILCYCYFTGEPLLRESSYKMGPWSDVDYLVETCTAYALDYYAYYGLPCAGCSAEEIDAYAAERWNWTAPDGAREYPDLCYSDGTPIPAEFFSGIGLGAWNTVSYGGVYEMLQRLNIPTEGTPDRFSCTGADGAFYEFSYDLWTTEVSPTLSNPPERIYQYRRDGEAVSEELPKLTDGQPVLLLGNTQLEAITGVRCVRKDEREAVEP